MKFFPLYLAFLLTMTAISAHADPVGFQELSIANGDEPPLAIGVWYPTDAAETATPLQLFTQSVAPGAPMRGHALSLVVISHGTGGAFFWHYDTAIALARAGFVAAALTHTGDTFDDRSRAGQVWRRPPQLRRLTDYMLKEWPEHGRIDTQRVGAFGFSAGGFTVLAAMGAMPDLTRVDTHCQIHPDYFDCQRAKKVQGLFTPPPGYVWSRDDRIRAAVIAAPALGFTFGSTGLKDVRLPIQLWRAEDDQILPYPDYADAVRRALPRAPEYHVVANAGHYDFLAPCSATLAQVAPEVCAQRPGFDRAAFHARFDADVVRFFEQALH